MVRGKGLMGRLARMTSNERDVIIRFRRTLEARREADARAILAGQLAAILAGDGTETFLGCAFDRCCAMAFRLLPAADAVAEVARLCDAAEAGAGPRPWTELYRGALRHLAGAHDDAVAHYRRAAPHVDHLWADSNGCASTVDGAGTLALARGPAPAADGVVLHRTAPAGDAIALVVADPVYLRDFGPGFFASLAGSAGRIAAHLHLVDPGPGDIARIECEVDAGHRPPLGLSSEAAPTGEGATYYAACRLIRGPLFLDWYDRPLVISDIDARYSAPFDGADPALTDSDVGLMFAPKIRHHPWLAIRAGMMILMPTAAGRRFADALARFAANLLVERRGTNLWYADQNALHHVTRLVDALAPGLRVADLGAARLPGGLGFLNQIKPLV